MRRVLLLRLLEDMAADARLTDRASRLRVRVEASEEVSDQLVREVDELLLNALLSHGLRKNLEPNEFGLQVEDWIDRLFPIRNP